VPGRASRIHGLTRALYAHAVMSNAKKLRAGLPPMCGSLLIEKFKIGNVA
jgi:hypothetical protein